MQILYSQRLLPFDRFIHQRLMEGHAILSSAAGPPVAVSPAKPSSGSSASQVERVLRRGPKVTTSTVVPVHAAAQQLLHAGHVNRGQKRPRSPSEDDPAHADFSVPAEPAQTAAQDLYTANNYSTQLHQHQQALLMQPTHTPSSNRVQVPKSQQQYISHNANDVERQHQKPNAPNLAQPAADSLSQEQALPSTVAKQDSSGASQHQSVDNSMPGHVEGMTAEELVAAATRAAAASGYCSPQGLADFVGTSLQVRLPLEDGMRACVHVCCYCTTCLRCKGTASVAVTN